MEDRFIEGRNGSSDRLGKPPQTVQYKRYGGRMLDGLTRGMARGRRLRRRHFRCRTGIF